ncbi:genetic suppressor element 1 isoform 2-T2 [Leptodactylus fuscus]|uniref:genetic suppressor element 1 isoform X2 n=1 Tax=Leptodactylus fuscus TaxID=238119 RepID=UPI003F4EAF10
MTDAPRSRKQRLMAAVEEEEAAAPGAGEGILYCFICGGGVPRGREVRLPVRCPAREGCAFFPFLQQQEPAPGAEPLSPGGSARVCAVCQRFLGAQWDAFERSRTPLEKRMYWLKRPYQCGGDGARAHPRDWNPNYDSELSDLSDNPLSDPEESAEPTRRQWPPAPRAPVHSAPCRASPGDRTVKGAEIEGERRPENGHPVTCYICGAPSAANVLHVQKQEHSPQAPFFPFLWLHTPPPGANPITPGGSARACDSCFSSLMQQWHSFDMANVPVLQRLYVVPLHSSSGAEKSTPSRLNDSHPKGPGACYLCGEDCTNSGKLVRSRINNGNAKSTMHFPFITQLPCPPGSRGVTPQGEVQSCRKCYGVLEDIWAIYRASQNEELITSVQSFLSRYHQVFSPADASPPGATPNRRAGVLSAHSAPTSICYVCGAELGPGCEYQLSINPPNRYADKEPFFPFLTVYPPAPRARPADSTGLVSTCGLCYHDLLGQWFQHEMKTQHPSSPWSRQYQVESFVCFFCRQEKRRLLGLTSVQLARLPVFLLARRVPHSLFVDDGKQLLVGACTECKPLAMVGVNVAAHSGSSATSSPATGQTCSTASRIPGPSSTASKVSELEQKPKTGKDPSILPSSKESCSDVERAEPLTSSMNHEPKSPSIGMLSTATRTTATVSPLTPSPLNGSLVPNGSPAASSALSVQSAPSSSFAAALRKLAKQAEEPRGSSISSESSPVSSPATNHSSPASTPKRGPMGPIIVTPAGHSVPNTPPVVTIAPTKTVNGVWRSEARQPDSSSRTNSISRERLIAESQLPSEKTGNTAVPSHLLGSAYAFAIPPSSVVQDSRFQPLNLQRPVHHVVPPSAVTEEYLRSFRPYHTAEDLRMPSLPHIGLDPAAAAAYYHNSYLAHHTFTHPAFRMDDSYCLSALRSPFYPLHSPGSLPPLHPSAMHLHLSGVRYPTDLAHSSLSALQSERITAERLHMDEELRQREREREREREKEREADREREKEREREREREKKEIEREKERERERELERQRERTREKEVNLIKNLESQYLAETEVHPLRLHQEERVKPSEQPAPARPEKLKEPSAHNPKPVQHQMHQPPTTHHSVPSLISSHTVFPPTSSSAAATLLAQRTQEEEKWLARQRRLRQEKEDRQYQVSEFRQQVLEQQLDITGRPLGQQEPETRLENLRVVPTRHEGSIREPLQHFGGPPPLISPKPQQHSVPTSLWNPVSLMDTPSDSRRSQEPASIHNHSTNIYEHSRQTLPLVKVERPYSFDKQALEEEELPRRKEQTEKYQPIRESSLEHTGYSHAPFLAELEKSTQSFLNQQRSSLQQVSQTAETTLLHKPSLSHRTPPTRTRDSMYIYDEFLQQHRRLVSKLDLEERRRKEAREKGYYYDIDDSYDESDEEEVRAHLRRVAEQPPLKLDTSSEKLEFLQIFGLTTQQEKERILQQKRRKRRRMLRERSQSPPIQSKRQTPSPHSPLSTRFSPDELNNSPNLEEKKKFLTFFDLSHVSAEQRRDKEKLVEMLEAIRQKNAVPEAVKNPPLASCQGSSPLPTGAPSEDQTVIQPLIQPEVSASVPSTSCTVTAPEPMKPSELIRPEQPKLMDRVAPLPAPVQTPSANVSTEKVRQNEVAAAPVKKSLSILNIIRGHPAKENPIQASQSVNGRSKSWEPFIAEEFAHQFHESVLQSTQKALQKHKGASALNCAEQNHKPDAAVHYNIPELQQSSRPPAPHQNGQQGPGQSGVVRATQHPDVTSGQETSDEEDEDEDEVDEPPKLKWQGIEAIFEAYQEHIEEQTLERQVLETQCKRLEAQHYNLSLTAEQISHRMADLMSQKQKVASERERLQAELEHFRKCLVVPPSPWSRGYFKGHPR